MPLKTQLPFICHCFKFLDQVVRFAGDGGTLAPTSRLLRACTMAINTSFVFGFLLL